MYLSIVNEKLYQWRHGQQHTKKPKKGSMVNMPDKKTYMQDDLLHEYKKM